MFFKKFISKIKNPKKEKVSPQQKEIYHNLKKSQLNFAQKLTNLFLSNRPVSEEFLENLEEILILADVNVNIVDAILEKTKYQMKLNSDEKEIKNLILDELFKDFIDQDTIEIKLKDKLNIILVVGVNGVGKTTSIAKLVYYFQKNYPDKKIGIVAGDTFRAGAIQQLNIWANRLNCGFVQPSKINQDPGSVIFDSINEANKQNWDILICDTAGRLENKIALMKQLEKITKIIQKKYPSQPTETLLILDATTGQSGISQAYTFHEMCNVSGIILTKLDSTSKGGILLSIKRSFNFPIYFIGTGEKLEDFIKFDPKAYVYNLVSALEQKE